LGITGSIEASEARMFSMIGSLANIPTIMFTT
jgi:hypothetical protein